MAFSEEDRAKREALMQPLIDFAKAMTGGDRGAMLLAGAPLIGEIGRGYTAARENIFERIAPGAARDYALAGLERGKATATSEALSTQFLTSLDKLANLGAGYGAFSLQELGAGARFGEAGAGTLSAAASTEQNIMRAQAAKQQALLSFLGSLAGAAGQAVTGGFGAGGAWAPKKPGGGGDIYM